MFKKIKLGIWIIQLRRLSFNKVTFCGDSATLYEQLSKRNQGETELKAQYNHHQTYVEDILNLIKGSHFDFNFFKIPGIAIDVAYKLAKKGRMENPSCVIK